MKSMFLAQSTQGPAPSEALDTQATSVDPAQAVTEIVEGAPVEPDVLLHYGGPAGAVLIAIAIAVICHLIVYRVLRIAARGRHKALMEAMHKRTRRPGFWLLVFLALKFVQPAVATSLDVAESVRDAMSHGLSIVILAAVTWLIINAIEAVEDWVLDKYDMSAEDNLAARRVQTQSRVLVRTLQILVGVLGAAAILMTFPAVEQFGASMLASAGVAGLVLGLAARPTVGNLIAGLQIAITQPIRLDDVVIIDGEWGRIEEITSTYVVVRIWDERRLIVPLSRVIEQSFQNWTRTSAQLLGTVFVHTDYTVPVDAIRTELTRICENEGKEKWDGRLAIVQVTDNTPETVQVRALVSAKNSGNLWDLRCIVREKLIDWVQREHPEALPVTRAEIRELPGSESGHPTSPQQRSDSQ
jgi:small-conductance mechanosensitive channel